MKNIIFDFDGTIADSKNFVVTIYNELAEKYGSKKISEEDLKRLCSIPVMDRFKQLDINFMKIPQIGIEMKERYKSSLNGLKTVSGIPDILDKLKGQGFSLGIISSNGYDNIKDFLVNNGIDIFDNIYSSSSLFGKHYLLNRYLKKHLVSKNNVVYIGDELRDINSCKKSGIRVIAVAYGYDNEDLLLQGQPDFLVKTPEDIPDCVEKLRKW